MYPKLTVIAQCSVVSKLWSAKSSKGFLELIEVENQQKQVNPRQNFDLTLAQ